MDTPSSYPRLRFVSEFRDLEAREAQDRGYLSHVMAEMPDGLLIPLIFYDPVRLQQDLIENAKLGIPYVGEPGIIVIPEITLEAMKTAVQGLFDEGYFSHFVPLSAKDLISSDPYRWPPPTSKLELSGKAS